MKDFDGSEAIPRATTFMKQAQKDGKPFFVWLNTSRMHLYTRLNDKWRYAAEKQWPTMRLDPASIKAQQRRVRREAAKTKPRG